MLTYICTNCGSVIQWKCDMYLCPKCDAALLDITNRTIKQIYQAVNAFYFMQHHFVKWEGCRHYFDYGLKYDSKRVI